MADLTESIRLETVTSNGVDVALVIVNNPPVNALSWHVRQGLFDGVNQAVADGAKAVVVICEGRTFIAGADISEFGGGAPAAASLQQVQAAMEDAPVPVIAAIHGTALGGGLEVALVRPLSSRRQHRQVRTCQRSTSVCFPAPGAPSACRG